MLEALAGQEHRAKNFGLFSLYRTAIGRPFRAALPQALPPTTPLTLAGAGQFVIRGHPVDANDSFPRRQYPNSGPWQHSARMTDRR